MATWGDETEDTRELGVTESAVDADGYKTVVEVLLNEKEQRVRVVKRVKVTRKKVRRNKHVHARRSWAKFGDCEGKPRGPEPNITYQSFDEVKISLTGRQEDEKDQTDVIEKLRGGAVVVCRYCGKTGHWSLRCPERNKVAPSGTDASDSSLPVAAPQGENKGGKYVPPSRRAGANPQRFQDDYGLRVTNLSDEVTEDDLRDLFRPFGHTTRIFLAKDRFTRLSRGFAFINYESRDAAESAINKLDGHGFDNLILRVEWAKPRTEE
jgi:translation initiation factor 3 subunit G